MRRGWVLLVICALAGAAWLALRGSDTEALRRGEDAADASGRERQKPGKLAGHVVHDDGSPAAGAHVTARPQGGTELATTVADADGAFLLDGLAPGFYRVRAARGDQPQAESWARTGVLDLRLTLEQALDTLRVNVVDPAGGAVPRFDARLLLPQGYRQLGTGASGRLTLQGGAEQWTGAVLEIWNARGDDDTGLAYAPARIGPLDPEPSQLEVRLYEGPFLEGVVLGPAGRPVQPVEIELGPIDRWWETLHDHDSVDYGLASSSGALPQRLPFEGLKAKVRADGSGRFRAAYLRPGTLHELALDVPDGFCRPQRREVRMGEGPQEIHLRRAKAVRVTVLGPDQEGVSGAHVRIFPAGDSGFGSIGQARTDGQGIAVLDADVMERVDPDRTHKLAVNPNYSYEIIRDPGDSWRLRSKTDRTSPPFLAEQSVDDWGAADTTIRLEHGYVVSGIVLDSKGQPVAKRHVGLCTPAGFGVYSTSHDGRFEFRGVPAGVVYMGLDDGGHMGGIVDRQRETMWAASFGPRREPPPSPAAVPAWRSLDVAGDVADVTLHVPATLSARVALPPGQGEIGSSEEERMRRRVEARFVNVLHLTDDGWDHFRSEFPGFTEVLAGSAEEVRLHGLLPGGTYAAWMPPVAGQYAYTEFPAEVGELVLQRTPGGAIRGRVVDRPPDSSRVRITVWDDRARWMPRGTPDSEGGFQVAGLPDSTWTVRAWCRSADDVLWVAEQKVKTGGEVELRLAPQPEKPAK
jgi:hypothetical protein